MPGQHPTTEPPSQFDMEKFELTLKKNYVGTWMGTMLQKAF
jgi:hypothetical protein